MSPHAVTIPRASHLFHCWNTDSPATACPHHAACATDGSDPCPIVRGDPKTNAAHRVIQVVAVIVAALCVPRCHLPDIQYRCPLADTTGYVPLQCHEISLPPTCRVAPITNHG